MTYVEQSTFFPQELPGLDSNTEQSKALIQNALQANKQLQQSLIQRAEELEAKLKEADELLAAATIAESQDEPEPEIVIPGAKKAASIFPLTDFLNPMSPFHEEATKRSSYVTNTAPHSFKGKDIEVLSAAVRQENERLQAYNRLQDPASDTWQSIDLERNTEGLDWPRIAEKVSDASSVKRTATDCQIVWKADKHPAVNHAGWSEDELNTLNLLVSQYTKENTTLDWLKIAEKLGTSRVPIDCMRHGMLRTRHTWSPEMDEKLVGAVQSCGQDNWQLIARKVSEDVSAGQCQYRWQKALNPELRKGAWTEDEDNRLRKAVAGYGSSWIQVAETIPGRTNDQCRDRWTSHLNKTPAAKATWTKEEDKALLALVKECGKHWKDISSKIGTTKNGQSCRLRYAKLMKTNVEGVLSTSFVMSALSQPDDEQRAVYSSNDGPTLISHREVRRIAPRLLPTIKGKGKEKATAKENSAEASQQHESSSTQIPVEISEEDAQFNQNGTIPAADAQVPVSQLPPRAKGKKPEDARNVTHTQNSDQQSVISVSDVVINSVVDTSSFRNSKRKFVEDTDSTSALQKKKKISLPKANGRPPSTSLDIDNDNDDWMSREPRKRGRLRKVIPMQEATAQEKITPVAMTSALPSTASDVLPLRRTRAQTRAAHLFSS